MKQAIIIAIAAVLTASSGCMGVGENHNDVKATDNRFTPNSLSIKQNEHITWTNDGDARHTVTIHKAGDQLTQLKKDTEIDKGASTEYEFQETGTYHVYCKFHSQGTAGQFSDGMAMTVTVA